MNEKIIKNFEKLFNSENLFIPATEQQMKDLEALVGNKAKKFLEFYRNSQPYEMPMLDSYVNLLDIDAILTENTQGEPGKYLAEYGVYVFAVTVGGNVICIDTNNVHFGDASVLIADSDFCMYNEELQCVEIDAAPDKVLDRLGDDEILELNYKNIKKCLCKIENSFSKFMLKLSKNKYEDIEEFLDD